MKRKQKSQTLSTLGFTLLDHLIEVVILNHREALFYDIVTICLDQIQLLSNRFDVTVSTVAGLILFKSKS